MNSQTKIILLLSALAVGAVALATYLWVENKECNWENERLYNDNVRLYSEVAQREATFSGLEIVAQKKSELDRINQLIDENSTTWIEKDNEVIQLQERIKELRYEQQWLEKTNESLREERDAIQWEIQEELGFL